MRRIQTLGLTCIAAFGCAAAAETTRQPAPHATTTYVNVHSVAALWQGRADYPRRDRLRHLNRSLCLERYGCSTSAVVREETDAPARDYVDALNLGDYGPMNLKFTGDRIKVKVRF